MRPHNHGVEVKRWLGKQSSGGRVVSNDVFVDSAKCSFCNKPWVLTSTIGKDVKRRYCKEHMPKNIRHTDPE